MNAFQRRVRAAVYASFRDEGAAPSVARLGADLATSREDVVAALHALADLHCLVLVPGTESVWMAHPFSGIETDFRVTVGTRQWFANCAWVFFLACVVLAGIFGALTASHKILWVQALPGAVALALVLLSRGQ